MLSGTQTLNFLVVGDVRSGIGALAASINGRTGVVCHGDLFHDDVQVRRKSHEDYYGCAKDPDRFPEWCVPGETNAVQYISHVIFDNPKCGETVVGAKIAYPFIRAWELDEFIAKKTALGDFCVIHVRRNPIACFVSYQQAKSTGVWSLSPTSEPNRIPMPASVDPVELTAFCRLHLASAKKIEAAAVDKLEIQYKDLFFNYQTVMHAAFEFLELTESCVPAVPGTLRLSNRPLIDRITNVAHLRCELPTDLSRLLDADDFF